MREEMTLAANHHVFVERFKALTDDAAGYWRLHVMIIPKPENVTRVGLRMVPRYGIPYHLAMLRVIIAPEDDHTHITYWHSIADWVWFATLPLIALMAYAVGRIIGGDFELNFYSLSMNVAIAGYSWYIYSLIHQHRKYLTTLFEKLTAQEEQ